MTVLAFLSGLFLLHGYSYPLFHATVETFSVIIAGTIFVVAWNTRRFQENHYFLSLGMAFLFIAVLDFLHMLTYKGMGIFPGYDANLPTQLWIAARYMQAIAFLIAPLFLLRKLPSAGMMFSIYFVFTALLLLAVFKNVFPDCFIEGQGLTPFKIVSEYVICLLFLGGALFLYRRRRGQDPRMITLIITAVGAMIIQELAFTLYDDVYGLMNVVGHGLKVLSFSLIYLALIKNGLERPYATLFRNLKDTEVQFRRLSEEAVAGVFIHQDGLFRYANPKFADITGYPLAELVDKMAFWDVVVKDDLPYVEANVRKRQAGDREAFQSSYRIVRRDQSIIHVEVYSSTMLYRNQPAVMGTVIDITDRFRLHEMMTHMAYHDALTGLLNRRYLEAALPRELSRAQRQNSSLAAFMIDIDFFKHINDTYGHDAGDEVLRLLGHILQDGCRKSDLACRFGGEEFVVILTESDRDVAAQWAERMMVRIREMSITWKGRTLPRTTVSFGLAVFPEHGEDMEALMKASDTALYQAKRAGRDRLVICGT